MYRKLITLMLLTLLVLFGSFPAQAEKHAAGYLQRLSEPTPIVTSKKEAVMRLLRENLTPGLVRTVESVSRYVSPGERFSTLGVSLIQEHTATMKLDLRGGLSQDRKDTRVGVDLAISW